MSKQQKNNKNVKTSISQMTWIIFRYSAEKFYGKISQEDFAKLGKEPVKVHSPLLQTTKEDVKTRAMVPSYRLVLDVNECSDDFMYFNSTLWSSWQVVDGKLFMGLESIVQKINQQQQALKNQTNQA